MAASAMYATTQKRGTTRRTPIHSTKPTASKSQKHIIKSVKKAAPNQANEANDRNNRNNKLAKSIKVKNSDKNKGIKPIVAQSHNKITPVPGI